MVGVERCGYAAKDCKIRCELEEAEEKEDRANQKGGR